MFDAKKIKNELVEWIKNYFTENGQGCTAVVGISGGKDSSIVAALCCEALGKERVYGVLMPQGYQHDVDVAFELVNHLGIQHAVINIEEAVNAIFKPISGIWSTSNEQARVNTPARVRMTVLYAVAACVNGRVANTCNLSEDYVGYSTKFGDSAGDFSPISNLTVSEVRQIGRKLSLPSKFVEKVPEDGLTGKTDEDNLGFTYHTLDRYIREGICPNDTVREMIDTLHKRNLHKLLPMPSYEMV